MSGSRKDQTEKKPQGRPQSEPITEFGRWYSQSGLTADELKDHLECGKSYAYELVRGKRVPSLQNAIKLIDLSRGLRGKVLRPEDFLPDDPG